MLNFSLHTATENCGLFEFLVFGFWFLVLSFHFKEKHPKSAKATMMSG